MLDAGSIWVVSVTFSSKIDASKLGSVMMSRSCCFFFLVARRDTLVIVCRRPASCASRSPFPPTSLGLSLGIVSVIVFVCVRVSWAPSTKCVVGLCVQIKLDACLEFGVLQLTFIVSTCVCVCVFRSTRLWLVATAAREQQAGIQIQTTKEQISAKTRVACVLS